MVYDSLMNPVQKIDANNITWQTTYDVFSRVKTKISPGDDTTNPTTRITYPEEFVDSSGTPIFPRCQKNEQKISGASYLVVYQYFNGLGRLVQKKTQAKSGSNTVWITVDHIYDNSGREYKRSVPHFTTSSAYATPDSTVTYTTATYDALDRVISSLNPDGTTIKTIYGKQDTLTVDENGHVTDKKIVGNIEYDIKYSGTYPSQAAYATTTKITCGDGVKTIDATGNSFIDQLDMLGHKVSSTNPVSGTWSYTYDGNNNPITQTDAKGQKISLGYDALNRIIKKSYPDDSTVQYYYDEDEHGYAKGRLTQAIYSGGEESYTYDSRGRKISVTQTIGVLSRIQSMTYNSMDQIASLTYPDGEVATYGFDQGGQVVSLAGGSSYVSTISYTPLCKISQIKYGNGVQTSYDLRYRRKSGQLGRNLFQLSIEKYSGNRRINKYT
jgi:YD repeat-containing protein